MTPGMVGQGPANPINEAAAEMIEIELRAIIGGRYSVATRTLFLYTH